MLEQQPGADSWVVPEPERHWRHRFSVCHSRTREAAAQALRSRLNKSECFIQSFDLMMLRLLSSDDLRRPLSLINMRPRAATAYAFMKRDQIDATPD